MWRLKLLNTRTSSRSIHDPPFSKSRFNSIGTSNAMALLILIAVAATAALSLWLISLFRILLSSGNPSQPTFLSSGPPGIDGKRRNVLLVIAHPDDESMFFAPALLYLTSKGHNVHILCLSTACFYGKIRKKILKHGNWQLMYFIDSFLTPGSRLISTNILRKYSGPMDIWLSNLNTLCYPGEQMYCLLNTRPYKSYLAMAAHYSQWVWFRKLFVLLSSYTYMNTLQKINP